MSIILRQITTNNITEIKKNRNEMAYYFHITILLEIKKRYRIHKNTQEN